MFKKAIIAEDLGSINRGIQSTLKEMGITQITHASYCDDAYLKIKRAELDNQPFDLLITDLSFKTDHRDINLQSGADLAAVVKKESPRMKVVVFTVDDRIPKARHLVNVVGVEAYVCKGRTGLPDLAKALTALSKGNTFFSQPIKQGLNKRSPIDITAYDIELMRQLANGLAQRALPDYLRSNNIEPSSLSAVEKRLNTLKSHFDAKNPTHLVALVKDLGLI